MLKYSDVKVWKEKVKIPTYGVGNPDKNPMFLEKRVYQGKAVLLLLKIRSLFKRNSYEKQKNYYSRLWILDVHMVSLMSRWQISLKCCMRNNRRSQNG